MRNRTFNRNPPSRYTGTAKENFTMKDNLKGVGIWGQRHYQYLKENKPNVIGVMNNIRDRVEEETAKIGKR